MSLALVREESLPASSSAFQAVAALRDDLANSTNSVKGAGQVGYGPTLGYGPNTVGRKLRESVSVEDYCGGVLAVDGVDFTAYIQAAVSSGAKLVRFTQSSGLYYFADVSVPAGVTVDLTGCKSKLKPLGTSIGSGFHGFFKASGAANITIRGGAFDGNTSAQTPDAPNIDRFAGLYFVDCSGLTIDGTRWSVAPYGNATIRVRQGSNVRIFRNIVTDKGIYYNAYSGSQYSVTIDHNNTTGCGIVINDDQAAQHLYGWSISHNRIRAINTLDEVGIGGRASDGVIIGNTIIGGYFGITLSVAGSFQQHGVIVHGNNIIGDSGAWNPYGIEHYAYDTTISGNTLVNCGIASSTSTGRNVTIVDNTLTADGVTGISGTTYAISLSSGLFTNVTIRGNKAQGHGSFCTVACPTESLDISHNVASLTDFAGVSVGIKLENAGASARTLDGAVIMGNQFRNASKAWLHLIGNGANTLTVNDMRAVFNPTLGTTAGILIDATASLGATSMHAFNESVHATFQNTPTASAGLATGSIWRDAADSNRAKMVP